MKGEKRQGEQDEKHGERRKREGEREREAALLKERDQGKSVGMEEGKHTRHPGPSNLAPRLCLTRVS